MKITYNTVVNVLGCGARILDLIEQELSVTATGEGVLVSYENIEEYLKAYDKEDAMKHEKELNKFLKKVIKEINPKALVNDLHLSPMFTDVLFS
jgi:predicted RNase H-like nuclease (RuvC/YqgF family)